MSNEKITIENYQQKAMQTCLKSARNRTYAIQNYRAELCELMSKCLSHVAKKIRDKKDFNKEKSLNAIKGEAGDCFWQLALCCELENVGLGEFFRHAEAKRKAQHIVSIDLSVRVKEISRMWILEEIERILGICKYYRINPVECLQRNIDKLASRAERGVLKGNGDER
jgi:NTP pyrophosphatase (non-canonical NTP hydrolase)